MAWSVPDAGLEAGLGAPGGQALINAGHEPPLILRRDEVCTRLCATGFLPGLPFQVREVGRRPATQLIAWKDGVTEAQGPEGFYREERPHGLLRAHTNVAASHLLAEIATAVARHGGGLERSDDLTLLALWREAGLDRSGPK